MLASDVLTVSKIVSDSVIKLCQTTNSKSELGKSFIKKCEFVILGCQELSKTPLPQL